jgi:hypothetical protein
VFTAKHATKQYGWQMPRLLLLAIYDSLNSLSTIVQEFQNFSNEDHPSSTKPSLFAEKLC